MSRISDACSSNLPEIELLDAQTQSVDTSLPAGQPSGTGAQQPAAAGEQDTFESLTDTVAAWFTGPQKTQPKKPEYGPRNEPVAPAPPFGETVPTVGLSGAELERARQHNLQCWNEYAGEYRKYLESYREAFAHCRDLDELRNLEPEPPAKEMALVGHPKLHDSLTGAHTRMYGEKVDRGYELIGEASPGTVFLVLAGKARFHDFGGEAEVRLDSGGGVEGEAKAGPKIERGLLKAGVTVDDEGRIEGEAGIGGSSVRWSDKGLAVTIADTFELDEEGRLEVGVEAVPGVKGLAEYDAKEAIYGGGISVGKKLTRLDGSTYAELEVKAKVLLKGMSSVDVKRALEGWLAKEPMPTAEHLRMQQAAYPIKA